MSMLRSVVIVDAREQIDGDSGGVTVHELEPGEILISIDKLGTGKKMALLVI